MAEIKIFSGRVLANNDQSCKTTLENIKNTRGYISSLNFNNVTLNDFNFNLKIDKCCFEGCNFRNCFFETMYMIRFINCTFENCYFHSFLVAETKFTNCVFIKSKLSSCLEYTFFHDCCISDSIIQFNTENSAADVKIVNCDITFKSINPRFFKCSDIKTASVQFTDHGQCGRVLNAFKYNNETFLSCGCFYGTESELRDYIKSSKEKLRKSRTFALETVISLLNYKD